MKLIKGFESTYEELKLNSTKGYARYLCRFESTYEELKHGLCVVLVLVRNSFESTYEELKHCFHFLYLQS